jgi:hypothetical protein
MSYSFDFSIKHVYPDQETGISLAVFLTYGDKTEKVSAKLDTGADFCVFTRDGDQSLGDGFSDHSTMEHFGNDRCGYKRLDFFVRNAIEKCLAILRCSGKVVNDYVGIYEEACARREGVNIHTVPRIQRST